MQLSTVLGVMSILIAQAMANPPQYRSETASDNFSPLQWLSPSELADMPSIEQVTLEKLEKMPLEKGAEIMQKWYHIYQTKNILGPSYEPDPSSIPVYIIKMNGDKEVVNLINFVAAAKQDINFGNEEVTVFITGLPSSFESVKTANHELIQAYIARYSRKLQTAENYKKLKEGSSNEKNSSEWNEEKLSSGNLIVIDLGHVLDSLERLISLDVGETGAMIGKALVKLINDCDVPQELIHIVAQGAAAHVAGAAADEFAHLTGHKLRRITALDPSKIITKHFFILSGLARGDAEFVDAIHTSVYGMGTVTRVGDIDFYPNGPCTGVPGTDNVIEASMRATQYFAESIIPGNERNFPAVEANSLKQYKSNNGFGKRAFMGIGTDFDLRGDYILQINENSPFGDRIPVKKSHEYYGMHSSWHHY